METLKSLIDLTTSALSLAASLIALKVIRDERKGKKGFFPPPLGVYILYYHLEKSANDH